MENCKETMRERVKKDFIDAKHTTKFIDEMIEDVEKGWDFFNEKWENTITFRMKRRGMFNIISMNS